MSTHPAFNPSDRHPDNSPSLSGAGRAGLEPQLGGKAAVPGLLDALRGTNLQARQSAGRVLKRLKDPGAVDMLLSALQDDNTQVRSVAATALGAIGAQHGERAREAVIEQGVPALRRAMLDRQIPVRWAAARALGQIGEPSALPDLLEALRDVSPHVRAAAAAALGSLGARHPGEGAQVIDALVACLDDLDSAVRTHAAESLGEIGAAQTDRSLRAQSVPALLEAFRDASLQVRSAAADALSRIGPDAVSGLIHVLRDDQIEVRSAAAFVLMQIAEQYGRAASRAIEPLIAALDDEDEQVRWYAVGALGVLADDRAVPRLVDMLKDTGLAHPTPYDEKRICDLAAETLERIGTHEARAALRIWRVSQGLHPEG